MHKLFLLLILVLGSIAGNALVSGIQRGAWAEGAKTGSLCGILSFAFYCII